MATNVEQNYQERILKVLIYIQNNLGRELSLEELAATAYFSPYHFHLIFTAHTNESIKSYVRRLRLERATRDLTFSDLSLVQISERSGYDTQQSFHRAFKEVYNSTPKEYRDNAAEHIAAMQEKQIHLENQHCDVAIKTIEPITVAFLRHVGPYKNVIESWLKLMSEVGMQYLLSESTRKISIPYDTPETTPENKIRYDACVTLDALPNFKAKGHIGVQTLHGGKYAVITHKGPIEAIESTYQLLFAVWLPNSGYEPADAPNFMLHRTMPFQTPNDALETDIYLPLK